MTCVILDLEWNGAWSKVAKGYFNEIIEIGAVRLAEDGTVADRFDAYIRPTVSKKLTKLVTDLTGITDEQVESGISFEKAMQRLAAFVGDGDVILMTWSTTDLLVFIENCRYFLKEERIPHFTHYVDLQAYGQKRLGTGGNQVSLENFARLVSIDPDQMELHHAIDDSVLTASIFQKVYEPTSFAAALCPMNAEFYRRITFRTTYISDVNSPLIRRADLRFSCDGCGRNLKRTGNWKFYNRMFFAPFRCEACGIEFTGRFQAKHKYEGVEIKKRLVRKKEKEEQREQQTTALST